MEYEGGLKKEPNKSTFNNNRASINCIKTPLTTYLSLIAFRFSLNTAPKKRRAKKPITGCTYSIIKLN